MSWNEYRRRGEVVRAVLAHVDGQVGEQDAATLPMHLTGVRENFTDELDLLAALTLGWHARLSGNVERSLMTQPLRLDDAVVRAWQQTAQELPGLRAAIDHYLEHPTGREMAQALTGSRHREWTELALAAGLASSHDDAAAATAGRRIVDSARDLLSASTGAPAAVPVPAPRPDFVRRIRAALVA